jgi:hypothetical protein
MNALKCLMILVSFFFAGHAFGQFHPDDVGVALDGGQIITVYQPTGEVLRVFPGVFGDSGFDGFTSNPGFQGVMTPGALLGFNATQSLLYWDAVNEEFVPPPAEESLSVGDFTSSISIDGNSGPVPGFYFEIADGSGIVHSHMDFFIFDEGGGNATPGAYLLFLELTSDVYATSEEFVIVFDYNIAAEEFEAAVAAAEDLFAPPCPADLDGSGVVNAADLAQILSAWGPNQGHPADFNGDGVINASDLAALLGAWGSCA